MSIFRKYPRVWCSDLCGRRIMLTLWHRTHGQVCMACWLNAVEQAAYDNEMRSLRGYLPEEIERI